MMRSFWTILVFGIILRIILSLTTFHSDMQVFDLAGKLVAAGNILNLYDFSSSSGVLNYPPLIYLYHGIFRFLFNILGLSEITQFNFNLLLLKLPYLFFDLLIGFILLKLFNDKKKALVAFAIWIFNPINLYATYMMGQFDIIPTSFIILSIYLVVKDKLRWAALMLGVGIAFKLFPIFLVVPLVIFGRNYLEKFKLFALALTPYIFSIIPYFFSQSFRSTALFASQSSKSLYANIPVSGGESIILFPAFLLLFYLFIWGNRINAEINKFVSYEIKKLYTIPLLLFFIFTHFHPQWLIWITPLLILDMVENSFRNLTVYVLLFLSWFGSLFFFDPSLTVGIFAPIIPLLSGLPSVWVLLGLNVDYNLGRSLTQTVLAVALVYLIYKYFPLKRSE